MGMKPFALVEETEKPLEIDIERLIVTRLLIEANSGGGKSYIIRKLCETTHGKVQQIILDVEGDFSTLREKFDYILAGKEGDIPTDPRSAELLARKVLELSVSIIIDLYDLKPPERIRFVKLFFEALLNAPKNLRHPALVILDEAQVFCPEHGHGEADSSDAVIDLAQRGRKRGLSLCACCLRIGAFNKNCAAQLLNKAIGRTGLDIDQKRAGQELGFTNQEQIRSLRDLEPGEFYIFGPALSKHIEKVRIGEVVTTHPTAGIAPTSTPLPTDKVNRILEKLTDLPKEAEKEAKTIQDFKDQNRKLRTELRDLRSGAKPKIDEAALKRAADSGYIKGFNEALTEHKEAYHILLRTMNSLNSKLRQIYGIAKDIGELPTMPDFKPRVITKLPATITAGETVRLNVPVPIAEPKPVEVGDIKFVVQDRMILAFLKLRPGVWFGKPQLGAITNYSSKSGSFNQALSKLTKAGLILQRGGEYTVNSSEDATPNIEQLTRGLQLPTLQDWLGKLPEQTRKIYQVLYENQSDTFTKERMAEVTGYQVTSGSFNSSISVLLTLGLAERGSEGVRFNQNLTEYA